MKISTNFEDRNRIREWAATGLSADEISQRVRVKVDAVQRAMDALTEDKTEVETEEEAELSPQQRGALTRRMNREAAEAAQESEDGTDG